MPLTISVMVCLSVCLTLAQCSCECVSSARVWSVLFHRSILAAEAAAAARRQPHWWRRTTRPRPTRWPRSLAVQPDTERAVFRQLSPSRVSTPPRSSSQPGDVASPAAYKTRLPARCRAGSS